MITAAIGIGAVATVMFQYIPLKTETPSPAAPPAKEKPPDKQTQEITQAQENKQAQENRQAQRWVCSHTTRQTVTILTGVSGAFQGYMDQCDEWKLKEP
jgi:hypothetical protein